MNRRGALRLGAAAAGIGFIGAGWPLAGALLGSAESGRLVSSQTRLPDRYQVPLPIPEQLTPVRTDADTDYYEITQQTTQLRILPELPTAAWTYNTSFPGPTIASRSGRRTIVRHRNALPVPVVVHLHGGHTPEDHDGYPTDFILPPTGQPGAEAMARKSIVGEREYVYPMNQRAATLWYHDHRMGYTGAAVWRGLAGFHLVHDDEEDALPLPRGRRDVPLMITDRAFAADGSFRYPSADGGGATGDYMNGVLGDVVLVNGAPWPVLSTDPARYRLRLLNASNARRYRLQLDPQPPGGSALVQIGSDGGLLARPVGHDFIDIAPAERFDVVVDFGRYEPGSKVRLLNRLGTESAGEVMRFDIEGADRSDDSAIPHRLSGSVPDVDPRGAVTTRTFVFRLGRKGVWTINDLSYQPGRSLARPKLGTTEIWRFITEFHHPIHLHLNSFRVISRNNRAPDRFDTGWKDTVDVRPAEAVEVLTRFTDYAGSYLLHCHNLEHEDMAMMADFLTVD
ncbi:multicopper oxidase family protein [Mycobacterium paraseoulense]|uniref:Copper oxidase n=2 Tax=Mycobacterium paraseoulense TaxID=590652 RepID=A0A1X0IHE0_9MYCO|nr:multicopper oxidase family protein [Mycobacterium paraseoulense]MCV7395660.1 multicopper oxidase family protein [Mycobacterium paraseoulense]ORB46068.1 copper oxidase [Mycobacterium paraseoulense]BBZ72056.1 spore coat protein A [Mycobacterium paraseoulense]